MFDGLIKFFRVLENFKKAATGLIGINAIGLIDLFGITLDCHLASARNDCSRATQGKHFVLD